MSVTNLDEPSVATTGTKLEEADIAVAEHLGAARDTIWVRALGAASEIADQVPAVSLGACVLAGGLAFRDRRTATAGAHMILSILLATGLKSIVKGSVSRTRPRALLDDGEYEAKSGQSEGDTHSFPSGHTADAVAAARALARVLPPAAPYGYAAAVAIAVIQVPRAKHYPIDLVGGALVGVVAEAAVDRAMTWAANVGADRSDALWPGGAGMPERGEDGGTTILTAGPRRPSPP